MFAIRDRLVDYHVHSSHSIDGRSSIDEMCRRAIELKIEAIGFCEHVEFEPSDPGLSFFNYDRYSEAIERVRSTYADKLIVRKGVEIDYSHTHEKQIREWIKDKDFDFKMGAVHYVDNVAFDLQERLMIPPNEAVRKYYTKIKHAAQSRLFDVIGHFDFIRSYVPPNCDSTTVGSEIIDMAFEQMISNKVHLEINSRRRANRDPFPSRELIQRYLDRGGELFSFGSDAHSTQTLGVGVTDAMDLLRSLKPSVIHILFE